MIVLAANDTHVSVTWTTQELLIACNALNEVRNGLRIDDFSATICVEKVVAQELHTSLLAVLDAQDATEREQSGGTRLTLDTGNAYFDELR